MDKVINNQSYITSTMLYGMTEISKLAVDTHQREGFQYIAKMFQLVSQGNFGFKELEFIACMMKVHHSLCSGKITVYSELSTE